MFMRFTCDVDASFFKLTDIQYPLCVLSHLSRVRLLATPETVARQAPLSIEFSRQAYWSGLPFPPPGVFPDPRIKPTSSASSNSWK